MLDAPRRASELANPGDRFRWGLLVLVPIGLLGLWASVDSLWGEFVGTRTPVSSMDQLAGFISETWTLFATVLCSAALVAPAVLWLPTFTPRLAGAAAEIAALVALVLGTVLAVPIGMVGFPSVLFALLPVGGLLLASGVGLLFGFGESPMRNLLSKPLLWVLGLVAVLSLLLALALGWRDPLLLPGWCLATAAVVAVCLGRFGWGASHVPLAWASGTVGFLLRYPAFAPRPLPLEETVVRWSLTLFAAALALAALVDLCARFAPGAANRIATRLDGLTA